MVDEKPVTGLRVKTVVTGGSRKFPIDEYKDAILEELDILRAQLNQPRPDSIDAKVFVLESLQEILPSNPKVGQDVLIRVLGAVKDDYRQFTNGEFTK